MPIYGYKCRKCGRTTEILSYDKDYYQASVTCVCGNLMERHWQTFSNHFNYTKEKNE